MDLRWRQHRSRSDIATRHLLPEGYIETSLVRHTLTGNQIELRTLGLFSTARCRAKGPFAIYDFRDSASLISSIYPSFLSALLSHVLEFSLMRLRISLKPLQITR